MCGAQEARLQRSEQQWPSSSPALCAVAATRVRIRSGQRHLLTICKGSAGASAPAKRPGQCIYRRGGASAAIICCCPVVTTSWISGCCLKAEHLDQQGVSDPSTDFLEGLEVLERRVTFLQCSTHALAQPACTTGVPRATATCAVPDPTVCVSACRWGLMERSLDTANPATSAHWGQLGQLGPVTAAIEQTNCSV